MAQAAAPVLRALFSVGRRAAMSSSSSSSGYAGGAFHIHGTAQHTGSHGSRIRHRNPASTARHGCHSTTLRGSRRAAGSGSSSGPRVGVDFGTVQIRVATVEARGDEPRVLENAEGGHATPVAVAFRGEEALVGDVALKQGRGNPNLLEGRAAVFDRPEAAGHLLRKVKTTMEQKAGGPVDQVVLTIPAGASEDLRSRITNAAREAGLEVQAFIEEPVAVALGVGLGTAARVEGKGAESSKAYLVCDIGGAIFTASVVKADDDGQVELVAHETDAQLGGVAFDDALVDLMFKKDSNANAVRSDMAALGRVREAAERAKVELTQNISAGISLPFLTFGPAGPVHVDFGFKRAQLEQSVEALITKILAVAQRCVAASGLNASQLAGVVMAGGMSRMPILQQRVERAFGHKPILGDNPAELCVRGAALHAALSMPSKQSHIVAKVLPFALSIAYSNGLGQRILTRGMAPPVSDAVDIPVVNGQPAAVSLYLGDHPTISSKDVPIVTLNFTPQAEGDAILQFTINDELNLQLTIVDEDSKTLAETIIDLQQIDSELVAIEVQRESLAETEKWQSSLLAQIAKDVQRIGAQIPSHGLSDQWHKADTTRFQRSKAALDSALAKRVTGPELWKKMLDVQAVVSEYNFIEAEEAEKAAEAAEEDQRIAEWEEALAREEEATKAAQEESDRRRKAEEAEEKKNQENANKDSKGQKK